MDGTAQCARRVARGVGVCTARERHAPEQRRPPRGAGRSTLVQGGPRSQPAGREDSSARATDVPGPAAPGTVGRPSGMGGTPCHSILLGLVRTGGCRDEGPLVGDVGPVHIPVEPGSVDVPASVDDGPWGGLPVFGGSPSPPVGSLQLRMSRVWGGVFDRRGHSDVGKMRCHRGVLPEAQFSNQPAHPLRSTGRPPAKDHSRPSSVFHSLSAGKSEWSLSDLRGMPRALAGTTPLAGRRCPFVSFGVTAQNDVELSVS